jgi:Zn-dependent protease
MRKTREMPGLPERPPSEPALATASSGSARGGGGIALGGGLLALGLTVLAKGKGLLLLLKAAPFAKLLLTGGTLVASIAAYAINGGVAFAVGLVLMILIHELGHGAAMKQAGVEAGWPVFIPFFGAMIAGRIARLLSRKAWIVGAIVMGLLCLYSPHRSSS